MKTVNVRNFVREHETVIYWAHTYKTSSHFYVLLVSCKPDIYIIVVCPECGVSNETSNNYKSLVKSKI